MTLRITTHYQVSITERRDMDDGISERSNSSRAGYCVPKNPNVVDTRANHNSRRSWSNSNADKEARTPKFSFCGPDWLHPRKLAEMMATRTSTIWGCAGRMADVEL